MASPDREAVSPPRAPSAVTPASAGTPRWFAFWLGLALALLVGFGLVGLVCAVLGIFVPELVVPVGAVAAVVVLVGVGSGTPSRPSTANDQLTAAGAALTAVAFAAISARHAAQHVLIDRDPGAYINTGRWLATHSRLHYRPPVGAFRGTPGLAYNSPAIDGHASAMQFQFAHLLGVLLAEARWLGGDTLMFALVPILGGISIAAFYAVACRYVRPAVALLATIALAGNVVELHFSRDAYSEILQQVVVLGGVWLLSRPGLDRRQALIAGILIGTTVAARIDGPLYLTGLPIITAIECSRCARSGRSHSGDDDNARHAGTFIGGAAAVVALAVIDVVWRSRAYARGIEGRVTLEYGALVGALGLAYIAPRALARHRRRFVVPTWLPTAIGAASIIGLFAAWFVRPYVQHTRGSAIPLVGLLQRADHLGFDPTLHYSENSMRWFAWYVGPVALAAGILGAGRVIRDTIRGGDHAQWVLASAFAAAGAVYLWNANALPDQLWVMRRFVPIVLPGFVLAAALTVDWLIGRRTLWRVLGAALAVAMVAWPISATAAVPEETTQANLLGALRATCSAIGPDAAVVVVAGDNSFNQTAPQAIRGFCGVPVAIRQPTLTAKRLEDLAQRVRADGRTLVLVSDTPAHITAVAPGFHTRLVADVVDRHELEQTLTKPPRHYWTKSYSFAVGVAPAR
jgi:hypothetical protein